MAEATKKVTWIGGPFDGKSFRVPQRQSSITAGDSTVSFDLELDNGGQPTSIVRTERELPIRSRRGHYYVIWDL